MRFLMMVKANRDTEAGIMPPDSLFAAMTRYNEALVEAGALIDGAGLKPSSHGARIRYAGERRVVVDGPFTEAKELVAGYWLIDVKSREEAIEWAKRAPNPLGEGNEEAEIEIRPLYELDDFGDSEALRDARALEARLPQRR